MAVYERVGGVGGEVNVGGSGKTAGCSATFRAGKAAVNRKLRRFSVVMDEAPRGAAGALSLRAPAAWKVRVYVK